MTFVATAEQSAVIGAELGSRCVVACAGSGKTATAVRRVVEIRRRLGASRDHVALLSYSNVAVDTFRTEYEALTRDVPMLSRRVLIATVDSFITTHIVMPHASRIMKCSRQPFLVRGVEPFLKSHNVYNGTYPVSINSLTVKLRNDGQCVYALRSGGTDVAISAQVAEGAIARLAALGGYTHELGRYWAWRALQELDRLAEILARRFSHILVDEAQDVGSLHGVVLLLLQAHGATLTLIGDPNQAIYEFADADGSFLRDFSIKNATQRLTENRRSVQPIVEVTNVFARANATAARAAPSRSHGAYLMDYDPDTPEDVVLSFTGQLRSLGYKPSEAAILCRGRALVEQLAGGVTPGVGATHAFAQAAIHRDQTGDVSRAFEFVVDGTLKLLAQPSVTLRRDLLGCPVDPRAIAAKRTLWRFLRQPETGLPSAALSALAVWQPALKTRISVLLAELNASAGLGSSPNWRSNVTVSGLQDGPLRLAAEGTTGQSVPIRTVHEVKGESIGAVLFLAKKQDLSQLLKGPATEEGRIGYVAVTRARDLLLLGVPKGTNAKTRRQLVAAGFRSLATR